jgi:hypothetical protein
MLSGGEARELEAWLVSARQWCESAQTMVGAATELTNSSRGLATLIAEAQTESLSSGEDDREQLASQLRLLAQTIEDEGRWLRDRFLATEADLELYRDLLD